MCRFLRYCVSHCLHAALTRLEEVNGEVSVWSPLRWLGHVSGLNLLVALFLGLWARWEDGSAETLLPVIFLLVPAVLGVSCVLYYYFHVEQMRQRFFLHSALGFLLGVLCFLDGLALRQDPKEQAARYLLLTSAALRTLWALLDRLLGCSSYRPAFLTSAERLELLGFGAASLVTMLPEDSLGVAVLLAALAAVMVTLRMRALLALPNLLIFSTAAGALYFRSLGAPSNSAALACFFSQLLCDPLLDFFFSGLSVTERWQPFLARGALWRRLSLLPVLAVEAAFVVVAALKLLEPHIWWLPLVVGVTLCALFWATCHLVFVMTVWGFHSKLSACQRVLAAQLSGSSGLDKVMASRGMRHLCLISERLLFFTLMSTVALAALCWQVWTHTTLTRRLSASLTSLLNSDLIHRVTCVIRVCQYLIWKYFGSCSSRVGPCVCSGISLSSQQSSCVSSSHSSGSSRSSSSISRRVGGSSNSNGWSSSTSGGSSS